MNLGNMSTKELRDLDVVVGREISGRQEKAVTDAKLEIEGIAKRAGINLKDLIKPRSKSSPKEKSDARYAHPDDPSLTWSGRGRMANWVKDLKVAGKTLVDLHARAKT